MLHFYAALLLPYFQVSSIVAVVFLPTILTEILLGSRRAHVILNRLIIDSQRVTGPG